MENHGRVPARAPAYEARRFGKIQISVRQLVPLRYHILTFLFAQIERDAGKQSGLLFVLV
jgi:hypothetical protein